MSFAGLKHVAYQKAIISDVCMGLSQYRKDVLDGDGPFLKIRWFWQNNAKLLFLHWKEISRSMPSIFGKD
jgi:hypothetical protein